MSKDLHEGMSNEFQFRLSEKVLEDSEESDDLLYTVKKTKNLDGLYQITWGR